MLDPQERVVLLEALRPPDGYTLDEAIGTTYSLDLITLISTPLAFTSFEWEDAQGEMTSNPVLLLEALRRNIDRLTVFCQAGQIAVPSKPNPLFGYLERCVVEVRSPQPEGVFHPKVWALRFHHEETQEVRYRLLCLSRNLTDDPSWDLSLVLEGVISDRRNAYAVNHPLADFIQALPGLAQRGVPDEARQRAERIAQELRRVDFRSELPEPFEDLAFHPMGIEGHRRDPLLTEWDQGLVISPFIDATHAQFLSENTQGSVLISRQEELDRLPTGALSGWGRVYVLASGAEGEQEPGAPVATEDTDRPQGLHAKLFLCRSGRNCRLFVGSANATSAAFGRNVEFLVELVGTRSKLGVDSLLGGEEGEASLLSLLTTYDAPSTPVDDSIERELDDLVNRVRAAMVAAEWTLRAEPAASRGYRMRLERPSGPALDIPDGAKVRVWPVTFPAESTAKALEADALAVQFIEGAPASLTTFLACEVTATHQGKSCTSRFALNLPLIGAPAGRREAILRLILDDPEKVLRFLQFLLNDEDVDPMADPGATTEGSGSGSGSEGENFVLLESLLKALAHEPERLDEVEKLLKELGDGEEDRRRIPKGLLEIWPAIWAARIGVTA